MCGASIRFDFHLFTSVLSRPLVGVTPICSTRAVFYFPSVCLYDAASPGNPLIRKELYDTRPNLFIAGHSHILKVAFDRSLNCLYINPGAAGKSGFHQIRTLVRFVIDGKQIKDLEVIELGNR